MNFFANDARNNVENFLPNIETNDAANIDTNKCGNLSPSDRGRACARINPSIRLRAEVHAGLRTWSKNLGYVESNDERNFRASFLGSFRARLCRELAR